VTDTVVPVVICGGTGVRLWPLSRAGFPKQFLVLEGAETLFQQALRRVGALTGRDVVVAPPLVVTNEEHRFIVQEQMREIGSLDATVLLEPVGRNTAPALTLAALCAVDGGGDPILVVSPADQQVIDPLVFSETLRKAVVAAREGAIVVLGVSPTRPETGYGYIQAARLSRDDALEVVRFVEKPDAVAAESYIRRDDHYWNAGVFVLRASVWQRALHRFRADIAGAVEMAWAGRSHDGLFVRPESEAFGRVPADSIDYAVMERCPGSGVPVRMVVLDAGWSDLGSWDAVWQVSRKDPSGNVVRGDVLLGDSSDSLIHADSRLVAAVGVENLIIVETADAVLVAERSHSQGIRRVVDVLCKDGRGEQVQHRRVARPWGWYDSIDAGPGFQVKRIGVKPGAALSLQKHHQRAEHWVVVRGVAEVTRGSEVFRLERNESTYIPIGEVHRLRNIGETELEIIEVQSGDYLGEDDIVRLEDVYGRAAS